MEEKHADLPENSTTETESQPITEAISFTPTETDEAAATTAPTEKKPAWKKVLGAIGDIVLVRVVIQHFLKTIVVQFVFEAIE